MSGDQTATRMNLVSTNQRNNPSLLCDADVMTSEDDCE